jgi:hypothetical protein
MWWDRDGCIARPACIHHAEGILADATRYNGANRDASLDYRVQAVLPVPNAALVIWFDGFTSQLPLAALDCRGHRLNAASRDFAVVSATVEPFLGQLGSNGHDLELQVWGARW